MDYERAFISKVIATGDIAPALNENLSIELFEGKYSAMWSWIVDHFRDFGSPPGIEALQKNFPKFELIETTETTAYYAEELRKRFVYNECKDSMKKAFEILRDKGDPFDSVQILNNLVLKVENVGRHTKDLDWASTGEERLADYRRIKEHGHMTGIPWVFPTFNELTFGMHGGDLILMAAKTGVGKTWAEVLGAHNDWTNGYKPLLFTNEMAAKKIARRLDAVHSNLPYEDLRGGRLDTVAEMRWLEDLKVLKESPPLPIVDGSGMSLTTVRAKIEQHSPDSVWIDGMYLMEDEKGARSQWERLINITRGLKILAGRKNIPVVVTLQLNEDDVLALSKGMERDGDVIIFISQTEDQKLACENTMKITKNREGRIGQWDNIWDLEKMQFEEIITEPVNIDVENMVVDF